MTFVESFLSQKQRYKETLNANSVSYNSNFSKYFPDVVNNVCNEIQRIMSLCQLFKCRKILFFAKLSTEPSFVSYLTRINDFSCFQGKIFFYKVLH